MAASSDNQVSATETPNPSPQMNGNDSTESTHQVPQEAQLGNQEPSDAQSTDVIESDEKRKRVEPPEPSENGEPKNYLHPMWKTSLCSYFRRSKGSCSHGEGCRYAHGEEELRPRPDSSWDPTSERVRKLLKSESGDKSKVPEDWNSRNNDVLMTDALADDFSDSALAKCLLNLPMNWDADKLRSFLDEQGILYKSAKKKKGMFIGFVNFESAEEVKKAMEELDGRSVGKNNLKVADVIPRDTMDNSLMPDGSVLKARSVRDVVTPLAHMPYADQLEHKKNSLMQTLKRLTRNARKACPTGVSLPEWILKSRELGGLPCKLEGVIESPIVNGYRNKCEFSVGYSVQSKPTVGFMLGNFREGVTAVEEPVDCPNVSKIACKYAAIFQEFLQHSGLPIWNRFNNTGFWRQLTVREGRAPCEAAEVQNLEASISDVMLMVQVCSVGFDDGIVNGEFVKMAQSFAMGASSDSPCLPLTALVIQDHKGISNAAPADAPLRLLPIPKVESESGLEAANNVIEARIHDYISNLQFRISPTAFFQVNTLAAEKLYSLAGDWASLGPDTLLFDICCGTGTIGLTLAHRVGMVVGIEMNASAVSDALRNAEINGITNCRFVCAKAEDVMGSLLKEYLNFSKEQVENPKFSESNGDKISAVVDKETSTENVPDPEGSRSLEIENGKGAFVHSKNDSQEFESQLKQSCSSGNGADSMKQFKNVVAIVDPPRVGLHPTVIKALRTHPRLRRLVYISCNPESLVANAIELCTPSADNTEKGNKNNRGWRNMSSAGLARHRAKSMPNSEPFQPIKAVAVDLFPHTPHCELVMLLER